MSTELLTPARSRRWDDGSPDGSLIVELAHHGLMKVHSSVDWVVVRSNSKHRGANLPLFRRSFDGFRRQCPRKRAKFSFASFAVYTDSGPRSFTFHIIRARIARFTDAAACSTAAPA